MRLLTALLVAICSASCVAPERAFVVDTHRFDPEHGAIVAVENHDTLSRGELRIFLRANDHLPKDSLTLRIETFSPDSLHTSEYHRLILPKEKRINPLRRLLDIPYRRGVRLKEEGTYYFTLTPTRPVEGVEAVGIVYQTE
ncbi:MAG: hypothetical protein Q4A18_05535 [Rikenellaceae bacterium]|nr:hypothetical protein [Rikenellaceae bacterium]